MRNILTPEAFRAIDGLKDDYIREFGIKAVVAMGLYTELKKFKETIPIANT